MNRRRFLQACGMAIVVTAIDLRLSHGLPAPIEPPSTYLMDGTPHFWYGINQDDPFDVLVWHRTETEMTPENALPIPHINSKAVYESTQLNYDIRSDTRHLELCAHVEISRGFRWGEGLGSEPWNDGRLIPVAQI